MKTDVSKLDRSSMHYRYKEEIEMFFEKRWLFAMNRQSSSKHQFLLKSLKRPQSTWQLSSSWILQKKNVAKARFMVSNKKRQVFCNQVYQVLRRNVLNTICTELLQISTFSWEAKVNKVGKVVKAPPARKVFKKWSLLPHKIIFVLHTVHLCMTFLLIKKKWLYTGPKLILQTNTSAFLGLLSNEVSL